MNNIRLSWYEYNFENLSEINKDIIKILFQSDNKLFSKKNLNDNLPKLQSLYKDSKGIDDIFIINKIEDFLSGEFGVLDQFILDEVEKTNIIKHGMNKKITDLIPNFNDLVSNRKIKADQEQYEVILPSKTTVRDLLEFIKYEFCENYIDFSRLFSTNQTLDPTFINILWSIIYHVRRNRPIEQEINFHLSRLIHFLYINNEISQYEYINIPVVTEQINKKSIILYQIQCVCVNNEKILKIIKLLNYNDENFEKVTVLYENIQQNKNIGSIGIRNKYLHGELNIDSKNYFNDYISLLSLNLYLISYLELIISKFIPFRVKTLEKNLLNRLMNV